jgi:hypothetical protein
MPFSASQRAEDFGVVDIQRTEIHPGPAAFVSILDTTSTTRLTGFGGMDAAAGLNASLLIGADDEFIGL